MKLFQFFRRNIIAKITVHFFQRARIKEVRTSNFANSVENRRRLRIFNSFDKFSNESINKRPLGKGYIKNSLSEKLAHRRYGEIRALTSADLLYE